MAHREPTKAELEAVHWLVVLDSPKASQAEIEQFRAWLGADDAHKRAYESVSTTSDRIDAFLSREASFGQGSSRRRAFATRRRVLAAATALVTACVLVFMLARASDPFVGDHVRRYAAVDRQARIVSLSDGSTIEMAPGTRVRVALSDTMRRVRFEDGVGLFRVAREAERPFVVSTRFGDIRVTGTSFVMRVNDDSAVATILSGRVEARRWTLWPDDTAATNAIGEANAEIVFAHDRLSVSRLATDRMERRLIWRERMVALDGQNLREAATEIERFAGVHFVFADAATAEIRLNGYIAGDDVEGFLQLLAANVGVEAERRQDGSVVLRQARQH